MREDFERIVNAVAEASDLNPGLILGKRRFPEVIDARCIVVKLMRDSGFYPSRIASYLGMTARNVNYILYDIEMRLSREEKSVGNILERARKNLSK